MPRFTRWCHSSPSVSHGCRGSPTAPQCQEMTGSCHFPWKEPFPAPGALTMPPVPSVAADPDHRAADGGPGHQHRRGQGLHALQGGRRGKAWALHCWGSSFGDWLSPAGGWVSLRGSSPESPGGEVGGVEQTLALSQAGLT